MIQKTETTPPVEPSKKVPEKVSPPKVDYATDLFNMLSMDGSGENATGASGDDNTWAGFQCMSELSCNLNSMCFSASSFLSFTGEDGGVCGAGEGGGCCQALKKVITSLDLVT